MGEFKNGALKSSSGESVTNRKQAVAIAMSEAGKSKMKKYAAGGEVPKAKAKQLTPFEKAFADARAAYRQSKGTNPLDPKYNFDFGGKKYSVAYAEEMQARKGSTPAATSPTPKPAAPKMTYAQMMEAGRNDPLVIENEQERKADWGRAKEKMADIAMTGAALFPVGRLGTSLYRAARGAGAAAKGARAMATRVENKPKLTDLTQFTTPKPGNAAAASARADKDLAAFERGDITQKEYLEGYKKGGGVMVKKEMAFMQRKGAPKSMIAHEKKEMAPGQRKVKRFGMGGSLGPLAAASDYGKDPRPYKGIGAGAASGYGKDPRMAAASGLGAGLMGGLTGFLGPMPVRGDPPKPGWATAVPARPSAQMMRKGGGVEKKSSGPVKKFAKGGSIDGCAVRGHTRAKGCK
jgi:hypothetical protein